MRRKKALLELTLWFYIIFSSACLILYWIPVPGGIDAFKVWLFGTNMFRLCTAVCMCVLLVRMIRLRKIRKQIRNGGHRR